MNKKADPNQPTSKERIIEKKPETRQKKAAGENVKPPPPDFGDLRRRAERHLREEAVAPEEISPVDAARLIHELRVHQIELEMQNDELRQTQARLEESRTKYADLYDFAPLGYLTLDRWGRIIEANLTAATILGIERRSLLERYFRMFISDPDQRAFNRLLTTFPNMPARRGEFRIKAAGGETRPMLLNVRFTEDEHGDEIHRLTLTDITELRQAQEQLRRVTSLVLNAQEQERQRIARDLHDELGQALMALKMQLNAVKRGFRRNEEPWEEFCQAIEYVNSITAQVRTICQSLRPAVLENLGLNGALSYLLDEYRKHHGLKGSEELDDLTGLFSPEAQITVYRLFQECLTNATRHGKADRVKVSARKTDHAVCFICEDNGAGFDPGEVRSRSKDAQGLGLVTMEERVRLLQGSFEVTSLPGQGTRIAFTILPDEKQV